MTLPPMNLKRIVRSVLLLILAGFATDADAQLTAYDNVTHSAYGWKARDSITIKQRVVVNCALPPKTYVVWGKSGVAIPADGPEGGNILQFTWDGTKVTIQPGDHGFAAPVGTVNGADVGLYHVKSASHLTGYNIPVAGGFFLSTKVVPWNGGPDPVVRHYEASVTYYVGGVPGEDAFLDLTDCDGLTGGGASGCRKPGMADYTAHSANASLVVRDQPLTYEPAFGPALGLGLSYKHRSTEALRPSSRSSLGPKWACNWFSWIEDDPAPTAAVHVRVRGGGEEVYEHGVNDAADTFGKNRWGTSYLVRTSPVRYERRFPDGSMEVFSDTAIPAGASGPRQVFLKQVVDPSGNAVTLDYSPTTAGWRLWKLTDAAGKVTTFNYPTPDANQVSEIVDPFGRKAVLAYHPDGMLKSITDPVGIVSRFDYGAGQFLNTLTTPYGISSFTQGAEAGKRWLEMIDPVNGKERVEFRYNPPEPPPQWDFADSAHRSVLAALVPPVAPIPDWWKAPNAFLSFTEDSAIAAGVKYLGLAQMQIGYSETFFWGKKAFAENQVTDSTATVTHWARDAKGRLQGVPTATKRPMENWNASQYPGQTSGLSDSWGTLAQPSVVSKPLASGTQTWSYQYGPTGLPTQQIDPKGRMTSYVYAANNIDLLEVRQGSATTGALLMSYSIYLNHQPQTITDAAGQVTQIVYNARGQIESISRPLGEVTTFTYHETANAPEFGRVHQVKRVLTAAAGGQPEVAATTTTLYDSQGRPQSVTGEDGYTVTLEYDAVGGALKTLDRVTKVNHPDSTTEETTYNRLDAEWVTDRRGRTTRTQHDAMQRAQYVTDYPAAGVARTVEYVFCPCGALEQIIDAQDAPNRLTSWEHDLQQRITDKRINGVLVAHYDYDSVSGRLLRITDGRAQKTEFTYEVDDRIAKIDYVNPMTATPDVTFSYDTVYPRLSTVSTVGVGTITYGYVPVNAGDTVYGDGQVASVTDVFGAVTGYSYDALGRKVGRQIGGTANTLAWSFDALGRMGTLNNSVLGGDFTPTYEGVTSRVDTLDGPNGWKVDYAWLNTPRDFGRLEQVKHLVGTVELARADYGYDVAGQITQWTQRHRGDASGRAWEIGSDGVDQLATVLETDATSSAPRHSYAYGYDLSGNRLRAQKDTDATGATYGNDNSLQSQQTGDKLLMRGTVTVDATVTVAGAAAPVTNGVWEKLVPVTPGANQIPVVATETNVRAGFTPQVTSKTLAITNNGGPARSFGYDDNGSMTSMTGDSPRRYVWDGANRLSVIYHHATNQLPRTEFTYDGLGRWTKVKEYDAAGASTEWRFVWDGLSLAEERDGTGAVVKRFYGEGEQIGGQAYLYVRDHLGSVREMVTPDGTLAARYEYDPWGVRTKVAGITGVDATMGFTGHLYHEKSGLHLALYRGYDAMMGRWLSRDPIGEEGGLNLYGYVGNDPVNGIDPLGLDRWVVPDPHPYLVYPDGSGGYERCDFSIRGVTSNPTDPPPANAQRIPSSSAEDQSLRNAINRFKSKPGRLFYTYNPFFFNCRHFVNTNKYTGMDGGGKTPPMARSVVPIYPPVGPGK